MPIRQRVFYIVTAILGIALFIGTLTQVGVREILQHIKVMGWAILLFILLEGVATVFYAWATRYCFVPESRTLSLWNLWRITLSERAISYVTPTGGMGGDVVKWSIFEQYCSPAEAGSAVVIYKLAYFASKLVFCVLGAVPILLKISLPKALSIPLLVGSILLGVGLTGFLIFQMKGLFRSGLDHTVGRMLGTRVRQWIDRNVASLDEHLRDYHRGHRRDFWMANLILWCGFTIGGILQAWVFAVVVLKQGSLFIAFTIWILGSWVDMVMFAVPAGIGTKELGRVLIFQALQFPAAAGAAFALILRVEELFWTFVGIALYVFIGPKEKGGKATK